MRKIVQILFIVFAILSTTRCKISNVEIQGKWIAYKKTSAEGKDGSKSTFSNKPYSIDMSLDFISKKKVLYSVYDETYTFEYYIEDSLLTIEDDKYIILKKNDNELILQEDTGFRFILYFKRG